MTIYQSIYEFLQTYIFPQHTGSLLDGEFTLQNDITIPLSDYLCNAVTIVIMILFVIVLIKLICWVFHSVKNAFMLR